MLYRHSAELTPPIITATVLLFAWLFFRGVNKDFLKTGIWLGAIWLIINFGLDVILMYGGRLTGIQYSTPYDSKYFLTDGPLYLFIPILTINFGYLVNLAKTQSGQGEENQVAAGS